ncbi:MAG: hypothetical protein K1X90_00445 [Candidatus Kapabacteria bacterium]|nr:hypothetical protein [Candidatus Kapabacteria bacterium]
MMVIAPLLQRSVVLLAFLFTLGLRPLLAQQPVYDPEGQAERIKKIYEESRNDPNRDVINEDVRGRDEWFFYQRAYPFDRIPANGRGMAVQQTRIMQEQLQQALQNGAAKKGATLLGAKQWEEIGPYNVGGRIRAIAVNPLNTDIIFIGAAAGGVWRSTDGGANWSSTFDQQGSLAMGAIAISPANPQIVYVGTGENTPHPMSLTGEGLFKSTDGGETWQQLALTQVGAFSKLYVHRQRPNIIYAATTRSNGGFYKSVDAGVTWTRTLSSDAYDLTVSPTNSDVLLVSTTNSIHRSTDGGETFTRVSGTGSGFDGTNGNRISIAMSASNNNRVYALISRTGGSQGNNLADAYYSIDGGVTWKLSKKFGESFFRTQGNYNNAIEVHPTNPDIVIALGIDAWRTTNGGVAWENRTNVYTQYPPFSVAHPDHHVIVFDPKNPDILHIGSDGGYYRSVDGANNWSRIGNKLPITQFYAMDVDQNRNYRAYGGTQDNGSNGTVAGTSGFSKTWNDLSGGDGFWVAVDKSNSNLVYTEIYYGQRIYRVNVTTGATSQLNVSALQNDPGDWSTPLMMSPTDQVTLYSARRDLWRTSNRGSSWQNLDVPGNGTASTMALSPHDGEQMMVGKGSGGVYFSVDDGATWTASKGLPNLYVTDLVYDPVNPARVYATFSGYSNRHVYRSDDKGANFVEITNNLPNIPVNAIEVDPANNGHLFVGTDVGMFVSLDTGATWFPFNEGFPLTVVNDLRIHQATHTLVAATFGRSMFAINIDNPDVQGIVINPAGGAVIETPDTVEIRWAGFESEVKVLISYDGGRTWDTLSQRASGSSLSTPLPMARATNVKIKVVEISSGRTAESGSFSLTAPANTQSLNQRGFVATALTVRNGYLWAASRSSDTLYFMKLPSILTKTPIVRTGFSGEIRDLAYDAATDQFIALVANGDYTNPGIWRMDTTGTALGQIPLPEGVTAISGIDMTPQGLALITPGNQATLYVVNPSSGSVVAQYGQLEGANGQDRRSLAWDGQGLMQGIPEAVVGSQFPTQLQRLGLNDPLTVTEATPVILNNQLNLEFVGLAWDNGNSNAEKRIFYATDTNGAIYRLTLQGGTAIGAAPATGATEAATVAIGTVTPNPFREEGNISFSVRNAGDIQLELWSADGRRAATLFSGWVEAGTRNLSFNVHGLAGGIYYVALSDANGHRAVRPVVLMR